MSWIKDGRSVSTETSNCGSVRLTCFCFGHGDLSVWAQDDILICLGISKASTVGMRTFIWPWLWQTWPSSWWHMMCCKLPSKSFRSHLFFWQLRSWLMAHMFATEALKILRTMRHFVIMDYDGLYREHVQTTDAASQITAVTANMSIFPTFFMFGLWCPSPMAIHASMRGSRFRFRAYISIAHMFCLSFLCLVFGSLGYPVAGALKILSCGFVIWSSMRDIPEQNDSKSLQI